MLFRSHNTNAGKTSEDGVWFGTSEPDDSKGALPYDTQSVSVQQIWRLTYPKTEMEDLC